MPRAAAKVIIYPRQNMDVDSAFSLITYPHPLVCTYIHPALQTHSLQGCCCGGRKKKRGGDGRSPKDELL